MLMQRVITALLLLPLLLGAIWFAPTPLLYGVFAVAGLLIAWEWTGIMRWTERRSARWAYVLLTALLLAAAWFMPARAQWFPWLLALAALWWFTVPVLFPGFPANLQRRPPTAPMLGVLGQLLIVSTLLSLAALHAMDNGIYKLLYLFFLVFAADTGAYFAGRTLGKHKLAPGISPGKTVEGAIGGVLLCAVWAATAGVYVFATSGSDTYWLIGLSLLVALVSIVGDLTESMFKRMVGIKDSGTLLPGHGGILDRVDSILAAAPVMVLGIHLTGL